MSVAVTPGLLVWEATAAASTPILATLRRVILVAAAVVGDPIPAIPQERALPVAAPAHQILCTRAIDASTLLTKTTTKIANMT